MAGIEHERNRQELPACVSPFEGTNRDEELEREWEEPKG
jgi:hypothetical protein